MTTVSDKLRAWVETTRANAPVGTIVHTLEGKKAIRATREEDGWKFEQEPWAWKADV